VGCGVDHHRLPPVGAAQPHVRDGKAPPGSGVGFGLFWVEGDPVMQACCPSHPPPPPPTPDTPPQTLQLPITEIFSPLIAFDQDEPGKPQYIARAVTLLVMLGAGYALHRTAPDAKTIKRNMEDARSSLMDYLVGSQCAALCVVLAGDECRL